MERLAIETNNLRKVFQTARGLWRPLRGKRPVEAVVGVNLDVERGELFGLLGPNGAGKTTLIKILCTLIVPSSGRARVMGFDLQKQEAIKRSVGLVVSDERSFYWRLSARRNLLFFSTMMGLRDEEARQRVAQVLEEVELSEVADRRFSDFSTGMRQRLAIARGLLHRPQLLFMDEPTRSLDPIATARLHQLVKGLARDGVTIVLTTHNLVEAESLCDRVALMVQGRIRACSAPGNLRREFGSENRFRLRLDQEPGAVAPRLEQMVGNLRIEPADDQTFWLCFSGEGRAGALTRVIDVLRAAGIVVLDAHSEMPPLEKVFAHHAGEEQI